MEEIHKQITPILKDLMLLRPETSQELENIKHPSAKNLFEWLLNPHCSVREFIYIIGELKWSVLEFMKNQFIQCALDEYCYATIDIISAEVLAMKCTIIEGEWEELCWILVKENGIPFGYGYGTVKAPASKRLSDWILQIVQEPSLCPNPHLRFELIKLLSMVEFNQIQTIEAMLSACSTINSNYLMKSKLWTDNPGMNLISITCFYPEKECVLTFDEKISEQVMNAKVSSLYNIIHDVTHKYAINIKSYTQPIAIQGISVLLKNVNNRALAEYKDLYDVNKPLDDIISSIEDTCVILVGILSIFPKCCQSPHLIELTAKNIMLVMELAIIISRSEIYSLENIENLLKKLCNENNNTDMGLIKKVLINKDQFMSLRGLFQDYVSSDNQSFPNIRNFIL